MPVKSPPTDSHRRFPLKARLISVWNWFEIILVILSFTVIVSVFYVLTAPFDKVRRVVGFVFRKGGHLMVLLNPLWRVTLSGFMPEGRMKGYVVVANHQSSADIPVISHVPWEMKWLSKESNFHLPAFGWMMRMVGDIPLHRGDKDSASKAMQKCRWYLDNGMPVMIFPEGTRSDDGSIKPFKEGAFRLAIESGHPILPIVVAGTRHCLPKRSWIFSDRARIRVHVLPPVEVTGLTLADVDLLRDKVRGQIETTFHQLMESLESAEVPVAAPVRPVALEA